MKHGWTKFSLCTSLALGLLSSLAAFAQRSDIALNRANELTVAGLRPGRDTLAEAFKRYDAKYLSRDPAAEGTKQWRDTCTGRELRVELDGRSLIQAITVSALAPKEGQCDYRRFEGLGVKDWYSGRGLRLGDSRDRITLLYGEPNSSGPSVKGSTEMEFLYYSFDWAGSDVPQVLEIHCARDTGRVVEITLAFQSL